MFCSFKIRCIAKVPDTHSGSFRLLFGSHGTKFVTLVRFAKQLSINFTLNHWSEHLVLFFNWSNTDTALLYIFNIVHSKPYGVWIAGSKLFGFYFQVHCITCNYFRTKLLNLKEENMLLLSITGHCGMTLVSRPGVFCCVSVLTF